MHAEELIVDEGVVTRLVAEQFPQWADLPLRRVPSSGTVNVVYRLGDDLVARLPFVRGEAGIEREATWSPRLAPHLPVRVPSIRGVGRPDAGYPSPWLVHDWIPGSHPDPARPIDAEAFADALAGFILALQGIDAAGAPPAHRSGSLARHDGALRAALRHIPEVDDAILLRHWDRAISAPEWLEPPRWVHGDLLPSNVLVDHSGALIAVIDMVPGAADPAAELIAAWNIVAPEHRDRFRSALGVDDATWDRGRGWAVLQAAMAVPYYRESNPGMVAMGLHALRQVADS